LFWAELEELGLVCELELVSVPVVVEVVELGLEWVVEVDVVVVWCLLLLEVVVVDVVVVLLSPPPPRASMDLT